MDYESTLNLKLARFLRKACAKLARNCAENSLSGRIVTHS